MIKLEILVNLLLVSFKDLVRLHHGRLVKIYWAAGAHVAAGVGCVAPCLKHNILQRFIGPLRSISPDELLVVVAVFAVALCSLGVGRRFCIPHFN